MLDLAGPDPVLPVLPLLGRTLAKAATSPHFQVRGARAGRGGLRVGWRGRCR